MCIFPCMNNAWLQDLSEGLVPEDVEKDNQIMCSFSDIDTPSQPDPLVLSSVQVEDAMEYFGPNNFYIVDNHFDVWMDKLDIEPL